ncbi:MAG: hypothetical protein IKJ16_06085 [Agathobacter sp.]|nr:hypothetical protein [Agathobacter sp.]
MFLGERMGKFERLKKAMIMEIQEHKVSFVVFTLLRVFVVLAICVQIYEQNFESVFLGILTLFLLFIPSFVQVTFRVEIPTLLECIMLLFIFAAEILGEINGFYVKLPYWDTMLHTLNGFLAAAIGFSLVDILNKSEKLVFRLSPFFSVLVAFCFSMTIGVLWEVFEFSMDCLFGFDMQKDTIVQTISSVNLDPTGGNRPTAMRDITEVYVNNQPLSIGGYLDIGLFDTMYDLIVNFVGAVAYSLCAYFFLTSKSCVNIVSRLMVRRKKAEEDYLNLDKNFNSSNKNG